MLHTNYYELNYQIHQHAMKELCAAVKAHGGLVTFDADPDDEYEWDTSIIRSFDGELHRIKFARLEIDPDYDDWVHVYVIGQYIESEQFEVNFQKLSCDAIDLLLGMIPDTDTVKDVTKRIYLS